MDVEASEFQDWEVLHNSDFDTLEDMSGLEGIDGDSGGIIRADYFSLDSQNKYSRTFGDGDLTEEGSVDSDNPSWIDPGSEMRSPRKILGGFWSDSSNDPSDDRKFGDFDGKDELDVVENFNNQVASDIIEETILRELGGVENAKTQVGSNKIEALSVESGIPGKFWSYSSGNKGSVEKTEMGVGNDMKSPDSLEFSGETEAVDGQNGDKLSGQNEEMKPSNEGEKKIMVWWKLPLDFLKYCLFRVSPVWTVSVAAAMMGLVILGRRYYRMKRKSRILPLTVTIDDKKVSQFMSRAARLNEAFSVVKRVPIIRPLLPAAGVTPWPVMSMR